MHPGQQLSRHPLSPDEEPFLIFANRYYLRKLNLDGSNYTLLKQVPDPPPSPHRPPRALHTPTLRPASPAFRILTLRSPLCSPPECRASTMPSPWTSITESK